MSRDPQTTQSAALTQVRNAALRSAEVLRDRSGTTALAADSGPRAMAILFVVAALGLWAIALPAFAQSAAAIPENAHPKSYGDGWECDLSFRAVGDTCAAIVVPQNAFATKQTYGQGWTCRRGFQAVDGESCVEIEVPSRAYLTASGERWRCARGNRQVGGACEEIELPQHAFLSDQSYGSDWTCERGYEAVAGSCALIDVPEHAYLSATRRGQPWTCERGYVDRSGKCIAVVVPANAFFDDRGYGLRWTCERGFAQADETCAAIAVPVNAHLDRSGNRWECDRGFQKSKGLCLLRD